MDATMMRSKFSNHFPRVVKMLLDHMEVNKVSTDSNSIKLALDKMETSLQYNVPHGKQTRGLSVVSAYYDLYKDKVTPVMEDRILTLGWAVEILQASFLVADDVMDQSDTRRGQKCWYRKEGIGLSAINDALLLESCVFVLVKLTCRDQPFYADLLDLFQSVVLKTELGQSMDMATTESNNKGDLSLFTSDHYVNTITYKTSFYSFYLPVAVALYVAGHSDDKLHQKVCAILVKIGQLFQIQDDYLDCFGDPKVTGKIGTDIEDNKCSWLMVQALKMANEDQIKVLKTCYGRKDAASIKSVKDVYNELDLEKVFKEAETKMHDSINDEIKNSQLSSVPQSVFLNFLNKIYRRSK